ncbi:hypothetical protein CCACVL1_28116 [Corchorus capsularis]|uniref:K Homology domain-containing protein n=1 Tax=Corchorus capsularis TaxID=210143 RepID=A0A1R3G7J3_COCAP|nr:hypothetical protein CCACVL1_28116 [Corchorus capsularis]
MASSLNSPNSPSNSSFAIRETPTTIQPKRNNNMSSKLDQYSTATSPPNHSFAIRSSSSETTPQTQSFVRSISTKEASFGGFHFSPPRYSTPTLNASATTSPRSSPLRTFAPAAAASNHTISLDFSSYNYKCLSSVLKKDGQILSIAISNGIIYTGSDTNLIRIWKLPEFSECGVLKTKASTVVSLAVSHDRLFAAYGDTKIRIWRRTWDGTLKHVKLATIPRAGGYVRSYIAGKDKMMRHMGPITSLAVNISDNILYSASVDKTVKVWRISDLKCIENIPAHSEPINSIVVGDDGILFTASDDATIRVWRRNFYRGEWPHSLMVTLPAKCSPVKTLTLTADGGVLYGGCTDGYVHYWRKGWMSGQLRYGGALQGHTHAVMCLATVSNYVISGSADSSSRVWTREQDGQHVCLAVLVGHRGPIRCVTAFLGHSGDEVEDGCTICTGSLDGVLKMCGLNAAFLSGIWSGRKNKAYDFELLKIKHARADRLLKFTNTYVKWKPVDHFQGDYSYHDLSFDLKIAALKDKFSAMDKKKRKTGAPVWRPICTQASSLEEPLTKDTVFESDNGSQMQEEIEVTHATLSPKASLDNIKDETFKEEPALSAEKHSLSVEVGASLIRFIRGKDGSTKEKIEKEMGVQIILPSSKQEDSILIEGTSADSVTIASKEIQRIVDEAVNSPILDFSHFVSLPLAIHPELVEKLVNFQNSILGISDAFVDGSRDSNSDGDASEDDAEDQQLSKGPAVAVEFKVADDKESVKVDVRGIPLVSYAPKEAKEAKPSKLSDLGIEKSIFIKPKTFHLTVLMLKLWNKERVNLAADILKSISSQVMDALDNRPLFIRLKGLDCMRGSLAKARVVYAPVEEIGGENRLLRACKVINDAFTEAGLVLERDARQEVKGPIADVIYTLDSLTFGLQRFRRKNQGKMSRPFDARGIFKQYGSEEWGEYLIREAHLSQRFRFDENGYYHCCASIPFPESMQVD